jgi:hypothetical protein
MRRSTAVVFLVAAIGLAAPAAQASVIFQSFVGTRIDSLWAAPAASRKPGDPVLLPGARGPWNPTTEIRYPVFHDGSRSFRSELAAVSWNALAARIAEIPRAKIAIGEFDRGLPLRPDGCSFTRPDQCNVAGTFFPKGDTRGGDDGSAAIPEPGAALLFGAGFALVVARVARRR